MPGCGANRPGEYFWPITAAPDHVCTHLLNSAIGGLVVAGQLRLWASESCSRQWSPCPLHP